MGWKLDAEHSQCVERVRGRWSRLGVGQGLAGRAVHPTGADGPAGLQALAILVHRKNLGHQRDSVGKVACVVDELCCTA